MIPLVVSALALWLHHTNTSATPTAAVVPAPMLARPPLVLTPARPSSLSDRLFDRIVDEAAAVWRPLGLSVHASRTESAQTSAIRVVIMDGREASVEPMERLGLGWIRFLAPDDPEPILHLSYTAACQLLDSVPTLRQAPSGYRDRLLVRVMGRALAHEIGHYVLRSRAHTTSGLMRSTWSLEPLVAPTRHGFDLRVSDPSNSRRLSDACRRAAR